MIIEIKNTQLELMPQKALWFVEKQILILADLHLGKASHFRKAGIAVPNAVYDENMTNIISLFQWKKPKEVVFLGDLFHSSHNREWNNFANVLHQYPQINFKLVLGNHDVLDSEHYKKAQIELIDEFLDIDCIRLSHEPLNQLDNSKYNIYGHIHPGVKIFGKARQTLRLPCFYFKKDSAILPAFGAFTGLALQKPKQDEGVYVIVENKILCINQESF